MNIKKYDQLSDNEKRHLIEKLYEQDKKSFKDIADMVGTYSNKVRRDAIKFKINIRDKSAAQKNALNSGKHCHPTKGKTRDDSTKTKIGLGVLQAWERLSDNELTQRKLIAKNNWENLSDDQKKNMHNKATNAVRHSSKVGSKLEKFLLHQLLADGYTVNFHQEQILSNTKLQIDLFIPSINLAIEVDGPSHFLPVWGEDALKRNQSYDQKKEGLLIGKGLKLIRIKQTKDFSKSRSQIIYSKLKEHIENIKNNKLTNNILTIED